CLATLHANNAHHALNRIVNFFPLESRQLLFLDLAVTLKAIVSQRLVRKPDGRRMPAVEILLNTRHISELIDRGEVNSVKEAMERSMAPGSQTFEQDLFRLYREGEITLDEALSNSDSPTNLSWLINNSQFGVSETPRSDAPKADEPDLETTVPGGASFAEFSLNLEDGGR
ncbi:MAG: type IV pili twitching motility protein PilT, partial [Methyloversatilis sp.]|nr:type IV pili twitching motility protein PilT [Methyloversatilis sp.]